MGANETMTRKNFGLADRPVSGVAVGSFSSAARILAAFVLFGLFGQHAAARPFTEEVWAANQDIFRQILAHPFLKGLQNGTLDRKAFSFYVIQDAFYLSAFARALEITAGKAPNEEWARLLRTHARDSVNEERRLHERVFREYGVSRDEVESTEPSPEAFAYTQFLIATAYGATFGESMAALLPCYWIYWEVGKELSKHGSKDPTYQKWIDQYSSEGYGKSVRAVMAIVDDVAAEAGPDRLSQMKANFRRSSRYEWMFWDSAYALRRWPPQ